jgi:hypothetical protein
MANNLDIGKFTKLSTIVAYFIDAHGKSMKDFDKCWILAFRALTDLNYSIAALPKSVRLPVQPNMTVQLPDDCLMWSKIGVLDQDGRINTIKINNSLTTLRDENPNRLQYITPDVNTSLDSLFSAPFFFNYYNNGIFYNMFFGVQNGYLQFGECRIDEKERLIILGLNFKYNEILIEYVSAPEKDGDYVVDTVLQEAIIAFIEWKMKLEPRELYYAAATIARRSMPGKRVTMQTINEVLRSTTGMYLKA